MRKFTFVLVALALSVVATLPAAARQEPSLIGKTVPGFSLTDITGAPITMAAFRGKVVLVDFWATWCVPCRVEIPHFIELQKKYASRGFTVIGISMDDTPEPVAPFAKKYGMNYPVVVGDAPLADKYGGILGLPVAFLIDRNGIVRERYDGITSAETFEKAVVALLAK
jgi:peroxiredoxin